MGGVLTGAGHGGRVGFRAEVPLVADAGGGALPDGVAVERTLGAGAVGGQSAEVTDLAGWKITGTKSGGGVSLPFMFRYFSLERKLVERKG